MELALYCASRALESWAQCLVEWGYVTPRSLPPRLDVIIFSCAVAAIMHCYSDDYGRHRDVFRSKYLNVLDFVFGNKGANRGLLFYTPTWCVCMIGSSTYSAIGMQQTQFKQLLLIAGMEAGRIQHVPSTHDLLASQGINPSKLRRRASALAASLAAADDGDGLDSPRSDSSEPRMVQLDFNERGHVILDVRPPE